MSTSIAIAASANATAQIAQQQAAQAVRIACENMMPGYVHQTATVGQMRDYAHCVSTLHPDSMSDGSTLVLKVAIILLFVGAGVGAWLNRDNWNGPVLGAGIGVFWAFSLEFVLFLVIAALTFLFT